MNKEEWLDRYTQRLENRGLTHKEATDTTIAGMGCHDYDKDPEIAADDELFYYADN